MVKAVALPDAIKANQLLALKRRWSLPRPLHVAALVVSLAAMLLTLRLTAEPWDLADIRLPLFGPRRAVPAAWLVAQQPVPAAIPLLLPEQVPQPDAEQPAATREPVQPAAADANQPTAVVPEPVQPAAVVVQPLATTDAAAAAAVVDAAAALNEAISTAAAAQIGAIAAGISAEPQAAAALGGALAAAAAGGATAIAGEGAAAVSADLPGASSVALRGLLDDTAAQVPQVKPHTDQTATPSVAAAQQAASSAQVSTGTVWGADPYGP